MIQARPIATNMIVITTGQCDSIATVATAVIGTSPSGLLERLLYSMVCAPCQARTPYCLGLERFLPLLPPRGKGRSGAHGSLVERLRTTDRLGATETWVPPRSAAPLGRTPSRCQTLMPDPDACHADPAATPRRRTPPSDPAIGSRGRTLLSVIRSGYVYEICVCIECVTLHVVHA
jgi:hypothetical protein